jgi:hypothetical protein
MNRVCGLKNRMPCRAGGGQGDMPRWSACLPLPAVLPSQQARLRPTTTTASPRRTPLQGHPLVRPGADYFATYQYSAETTAPSGQSFVLTFWHRPLPAMISAFTAAGFRIAAIDEPLTAPGTPRELLPDFLKDKPPGSGFLCFMFFVLEADLDGTGRGPHVATAPPLL